jgi:hypothetical protein
MVLRSWREVNVLASADGARLRRAFAARLDELRMQKQSSSAPAPQAELSSHGNDATFLPTVTRQRDRQHPRFIIKQPCLVWPAAVRSASTALRPSPLARIKGSDEFTSHSATPITASCIAPEPKSNGGQD